jgi:hypothetical protein
MSRINKVILLSVILFVSFQCKENKKHAEASRVVKEWMGKTIQFPEDAQCNILGKDTIPGLCSGAFHKEYKILLYVDSSGCSSCRLRLFQWQQLIEEAGRLFEGSLSFLFFFQPKNKQEMDFLFQRDKFAHPVFIDMNNTINRLNHFPPQEEYQCFLLDKGNKVLIVGNPTFNSKIWELYKEQISGEKIK